MRWSFRLLLLVCTLVLAACGARSEARAPDGEHAGWTEAALGREPDMALVIRRDRTRKDAAIGQLVESLLVLNHASTLCESDPIPSAALLEARELEVYALRAERPNAPDTLGPTVVVLRDVPAHIAVERSTLYQAKGTAGAARVYVQRRPAPSHVLYVFEDGTWLFSSASDTTARLASHGAPPRSQLEPEAMIAARVSSAFLTDGPALTGVEHEISRGLSSATLFAHPSTPDRPIAFGIRYLYGSDADAERARGVLSRALASGHVAAKTGLDPALVAKIMALFRMERRGRTLSFELDVNSDVVAELSRLTERS